MLLGRNFDFFVGYLVVTAHYFVVTSRYLVVTACYCSLLVVTARSHFSYEWSNLLLLT